MNHEWQLLGAYWWIFMNILLVLLAVTGLKAGMRRYWDLNADQKYAFWVTAYMTAVGLLWCLGLVILWITDQTKLSSFQSYYLVFGGIAPAIAVGTVFGFMNQSITPTPNSSR